MPTKNKRFYARIGAQGRARNTTAQKEAARRNGLLGGRPRKVLVKGCQKGAK